MLDHKILNRGSNRSYRVLVVNMKKVNVFSFLPLLKISFKACQGGDTHIGFHEF